MENIVNKLDDIKKRAYARADIEFAKMQLRNIIGGFPAICDLMVVAIKRGKITQGQLRTYITLISDLDRIESRIEDACKILNINPLNCLEDKFDFLNTLKEQRKFLQDIYADFNKLVKEGKIQVGDE